MRTAVVLLVCAACTGGVRPAVTPMLSELPADPERRNAVLDSAHAQPGPEQQPVSKRARKVETAAATAAAWLGVLLSDHRNVTLGAGTTFDENQLIDPQPAKQPKPKPAPEPLPREEPLVPWIQLN